MLDIKVQRRLLQGTIALGSLVPILTGAVGAIGGPDFLRGVVAPVAPDLDSHFRYLSGLLLAIGIAFVSCIPAIERQAARFRLLGTIVIVGGVGRLMALAGSGVPGREHQIALILELVAMPLLLLWQAKVARRSSD